MGAGGSLPSSGIKSQEPPPLPPPFYTRNPQSGISRMSGSSCDFQRDRRTSGTSTVNTGNPGFQHPRSSGSVKNEEWWHHRPSAPSLPGLRPQQETLLTYAAQMTGWQSGCENAAVPSMHQEAMELSRTVSHLAAANHQLASAHTTILAQLETLYLELNRERELRFEGEREERGAINLASNCDNEREKLTDRRVNLDGTSNEKSIGREFFSRDRKLSRGCHEETTELPSSSSSSLTTRDTGVQSENFTEKLEFRLGLSRLETNNNSCKRLLKRENHETGRALFNLINNEDFEKNEENDLSLEYGKAVNRIRSLENELAIYSRVDSTRLEIDDNSFESEDTRSRKKNDDGNLVRDYENIDGRTRRREVKNFIYDFEELSREIERLKNERLEYREINEKLTVDLENRAMMMDTLRRDYEISRSQWEKIESSLKEREKQFDALVRDYESAISEKSRLTNELRIFNYERETTNARIADLEKKLADSNNEKEHVSRIENQENSRLRKILSEEMTSRKEETRALEEALREIQRLNELIENGENNDEARGQLEITENTENESSPEEEVLDSAIAVARSSNMEEFRKELSLKREARQRAIAAVSSEMDRLRRELDAEKEAHSETSRVLDLLKSGQATSVVTNQEIIDGDVETAMSEDSRDTNDWQVLMKPDPELSSNEADARALTDILKVSDELKSSIRIQTEKIDDLRYHLECEPEGHKNRIASLKDIAKRSRESSGIRERQMNKLKNLLAQILARLGDPRFRVEISDDVRSEHDRQLEDIRRLKCLYDDRLRVLADLRESASKELTDVRDKLKSSRKDNCVLEEDLKKAEEKIDNQDTEISNLESQLGLTKADCRDLQNQMSVINGLFTQMLLSASSADMDLDRLTRLLQENHDLISDMAREEGTEAAALPKLLLDIVEQVEGRGGGKSGDGESDKKEDDPQEENIAHNLPKVWRVLLELLSCHAAESPTVTPASLSTDPNSCYKSVDTPSGPRLVISVSKTYIRLKELILEKKHLEKEMNRMKTLNTHLESKLGEQEKRLSTVSSELSKTWNIVGRMQAQHQQLHTHEKILRYELQQKRKMLQELKQELEYCREKWESARQKNTNTEIEWRSLRREFAARKSLAAQDSLNNSGESGFSDERGDDSDEEDEAVGERVRIGPRRRARKENPRAPTPDTESEQPTDTELSETKTTPETNVSTEDVSIASTSGNFVEKLVNDEPEVGNQSISLIESEDNEEPAKPTVNRLDRALTNVIENLITVDESNDNRSAISFSSTESKYHANVPSTCSIQPEVEKKCIFHEKKSHSEEEISDRSDAADPSKLSVTETDETEATSTSPVSVFSIGPFSTSSTLPPAKCVQFSDPLIVGPSIQLALPVFGDLIPETENSTETKDNEEVDGCIATARPLINDKEFEEIEETEESKRLVAGSLGNLEKERLTEVTSRLSEDTAVPSTSTAETSLRSLTNKPVRSHEEVLAARAARLRRLEEQADWLMKKMNATSVRGSALTSRLEELHEVYGEAPVPPPMPDVLPNVRIPSLTGTSQEKEEKTKKDSRETPPPDSP